MTQAQRISGAVVVVLLAAVSAATAAQAAAVEEKPQVELLWGVRIPLRDGVELAATIFKPKPQAGPLPVVFTLTPYLADTYTDRALYFATAKEFPPHFATIVPAAAAHPGVDFPAFKNVFSTYVIRWLTYTSGETPNVRFFGE